jgi:hypothetical protein
MTAGRGGLVNAALTASALAQVRVEIRGGPPSALRIE